MKKWWWELDPLTQVTLVIAFYTFCLAVLITT